VLTPRDHGPQRIGEEAGVVEAYDAVVIGGGQAGLAMSWHLHDRDVDHVVLERGVVAQRWRTERWDSLRFQFPNWSLELPGWRYDGSDPDGFAHYGEVAEVVERYAAPLRAAIRQNTGVTAVRPEPDDSGWTVSTPDATLRCRAVVVATGPFQTPVIPALAAELSSQAIQLHSRDYRNPDQLGDGATLVVGSGGSGSQIAEELCDAGRQVHLAVSAHRWVPRRYRGRDALWWLLALGALDRPVTDLPDRRPPPSLLVTGVGGGHDMNLRQLHDRGVQLHGSLLGAADSRVTFADNAETVAAAADEACAQILRSADEYAARHRLDLPAPSPGRPATPIAARTQLDLQAADVRSVVWCTGYRPDFSWVQAPCFDMRGLPWQTRGVTTSPGLYFLGLHWMHTIKSGLFFGVGDDAAHLADVMTGHQP
jgi:putative flavoprotein involved in K+ transport